MKKQNKTRTQIANLPTEDNVADERLAQVAGGRSFRRSSFGGMRLSPTFGAAKNGTCTPGTTYPASMTRPGEVDTATDTNTD